MSFSLKLPEPWTARGWKVKIRDRERLEPPHATILHKVKAWRFDLRSQTFLDTDPEPREVPEEVTAAVRSGLTVLVQQWNRMYPHNPVSSNSGRRKQLKQAHRE